MTVTFNQEFRDDNDVADFLQFIVNSIQNETIEAWGDVSGEFHEETRFVIRVKDKEHKIFEWLNKRSIDTK